MVTGSRLLVLAGRKSPPSAGLAAFSGALPVLSTWWVMYDFRAASAAQIGSLARENAVLPASSAVTLPSKSALPMHP
eukprot:7212118-Prymnesium_polylepis.1